MRCRSVRLLLVAMLATQHTDFESFANALGALPNQPPVPMACEPSPSPIDMHSSDCVRACVSFSVILLSIMRHVKKPFIFEIPHSSFLISGYAPKHHYLVPVLYPYQVAARAD